MKNKKLMIAFAAILILPGNMFARAVGESNKHGGGVDQATVLEKTLAELEQTVFHQQYNHDVIANRILRLEKSIFGRMQGGSIQHRIDELIVHESDRMPAGSENTTPAENLDEMPKSAPQRSGADAADSDQESTSVAVNQQTIEQCSWDTSALIDGMLNAEENADSAALDEAVSKLYQMPQAAAQADSEKLRTASIYHQRGFAALRQGKLKDALTNLQAAQKLNPWDATMLNDLVTAQIKTGDLKDAILYAPAAISVAPSSAIAWCNMAEVFGRAKQCARARGCTYFACLMSDDPNQTLSTIQEKISTIDEVGTCAAFREGLLIARYTLRGYNKGQSSDSDQGKAIGQEADTALYKANILAQVSSNLRQMANNSGIVLSITVSESGQIIKKEILHSSGSSTLDNVALNAIANVKLPPLPKSITDDKQQFLIPIDKIQLALSDIKHG